ncbi:MAG: hypothetical protein QOJ65_1862 [Fimbriimonadaceae bacterium]|jgi:hypothetical protein|nr:hypothetical protein [Fimbriimonadaceae bacterium]
MTEKDDLTVHRETMKIEGDRNLYSYTFTDSNGRLIEPARSSTPAPVEGSAGAGNLTPEHPAEDRKG